MSVTYKKMWRLLREQGMTKKALMQQAHIAPGTVSMMTHNKEVSMSTLVSICKVLKCDIGDIVSLSTEEQEVRQATTEYVKELNKPQIIKEAIEIYIEKNNISKMYFADKAGVSFNTLTRILEGKQANLSTYQKLMRIMSQEIMENVERHCTGIGGSDQ